jgi:hypothetical protein
MASLSIALLFTSVNAHLSGFHFLVIMNTNAMDTASFLFAIISLSVHLCISCRKYITGFYSLKPVWQSTSKKVNSI